MSPKQKRSLMRFSHFLAHVHRHWQVEERVIFPFIVKHVPRLTPDILRLRKEHVYFKKQSEKVLRLLCANYQNLDSDNLSVRGLMRTIHLLAQLVTSHTVLENEIIHKVLSEDLKPYERKKLASILSREFVFEV